MVFSVKRMKNNVMNENRVDGCSENSAVCVCRRIYSESLGCGGIGAALETLLLASGRGLGVRLSPASVFKEKEAS